MLDVAYFGAPGLPATLTKIPLVYVAHALRWLSAQPQVRKDQIYVLGGSRGPRRRPRHHSYPTNYSVTSPSQPHEQHDQTTHTTADGV